MPQTFGPILSPSDIILNTLQPGHDIISNVVDNTTTKYDSVQIILQLSTTIIRPSGFFVIGILSSMDGVDFTDFSQSEKILTHIVANSNKKYPVVLTQLPMYFKFVLQNRLGGQLEATGNTFTYFGVNN